MRNLVVLVIVIALSFSSCKKEKTDWIDRTKHKGLNDISLSDNFETYATETEPKNLEITIDNLEQAKLYFDKTFNEDLNFAVLFVDNKNWNTYAFSPPPGMPQASYGGNIILGLNKSTMANGFEQALTQMPSQVSHQLKNHFGDPIDLDKFFRDGLALHELGHLYQFYKTGKNSQRKWLNELFGNLCQVAAAKNLKDQSTFNQMDFYQNFLIRGNQWGTLNYKTIDQFEENYFEVVKSGRNYGWYQTQFFMMAKELYARYGDEFVNKFRDFLIISDADEMGKLDDEKLNSMMLKEFGEDVMNVIKWKHTESE